MVTLICKERGYTSSLAWSIVVGKLGQGKKFRPVILLVVAVNVEVLLEVLEFGYLGNRVQCLYKHLFTK